MPVNPSRLHRDCEEPISDKTVWLACTKAAKEAGIRKPTSPHLIRHSWVIVLPQQEMLPKNFSCFFPKSDVERSINLSSVKTVLQDTGPGW
jgi:hypothetical protein